MIKSLKLYLAVVFMCTVIGVYSPIMANAPITDSQALYAESHIPARQPYSKKALAMKFIMAMIGVGASSVVIYVGLSVYNRFIYGTTKKMAIKTEDEDFKTPDNMKDALNIFLKKTKN